MEIGSTVVVVKLLSSDKGEAVGNDIGVVLTTSKHFLDVRLNRTGKVVPFFKDQLRVL